MASLRLISTDFDGTIFDESTSPRIAPEFVDWMRGAQKAGAIWAVNTGRGFLDVLKIIDSMALGIRPDYILSVERHIHRFDKDFYAEHQEWNAICQYEHYRLFKETQSFFHQLRRSLKTQYDVDFFEEDFSPLCIAAKNEKDADAIHAKVLSECLAFEKLTVMRNSRWFRFCHSGYNKGTALAEVARELGLKREEVFAAGDHHNDLPMLNGVVAAAVAAPSNAIEDVKKMIKEVGGYVASKPFSLGTLEALEHFSSRKPSRRKANGGSH